MDQPDLGPALLAVVTWLWIRNVLAARRACYHVASFDNLLIGRSSKNRFSAAESLASKAAVL